MKRRKLLWTDLKQLQDYFETILNDFIEMMKGFATI